MALPRYQTAQRLSIGPPFVRRRSADIRRYLTPLLPVGWLPHFLSPETEPNMQLPRDRRCNRTGALSEFGRSYFLRHSGDGSALDAIHRIAPPDPCRRPPAL